jgi:3-dehydroquinate dehydratase/shikimate dehydrogenase
LLSIHDFEKTPPLPRTLQHARRGEAGAVKIAVRARSISDSLELLRLAEVSSDLVAVPMGEIGLPARLLALSRGSAMAYAPVAEATAPGQVSLREVKTLYRTDTITRETEIYGVIGNPISHSLSPLLHNTAFVAAKRDAVYLPFLVENLKEFVRAVPEFPLRGFSITIPHKEAITKYLADCEPMAEKIGAVNTVTVGKNGKLHGSNSDYLGVLRALDGKINLKDSRVLILGAGVAGLQAIATARRLGAVVLICARRESAARELARLRRQGNSCAVSAAVAHFEVIINATPVGMYPQADQSPLLAKEINCELVMDLIYRPLQTQLLRIAADHGIKTVSGVEMFLAQGFLQQVLWMNKAGPEMAMRRAVMAQLRADEKRRK